MEKLSIDTPEQVTLEFSLAGIGSRFLAVALDTVIQVLAVMALYLLAYVALPKHLQWLAAGDKWLAAGLISAGFCLYWGYYAFFEAIWKGQTPGKRRAHIRVIKDSGRPINAFEAVARNFLRIVDWMPGLYAAGVITMWLNRRHRRLGDYVAGTLVVHETRETSEGGLVWNLAEASPIPNVSTLSARELEVIEVFLGRRLELPAEVRRATARQMAEMLATRLQINLGEQGPDEDFLERLAVQIRNSRRFG